MIHVHIEASSVADLQSELKALLDGQCSTTAICDMALNAPKVEAPTPDDENDEEPKVEATMPDGESDEEPKTDEPAPVKDEDEADGEPQPTMEETRAALNAYRKKNGIAALKELFAAHGVKNFLELPATEYAAIMKEAKADV